MKPPTAFKGVLATTAAPKATAIQARSQRALAITSLLEHLQNERLPCPSRLRPSVTVRADRSWAVKANSNDPEQSTIGHEDGHDLVQPPGDGSLETLTEDQWCIIEVLLRGKTMYDNDRFELQAAKRKRKKNLHDQISLNAGIRTLSDEQWNDGFDLERQQRWEAGESTARHQSRAHC
ncbi:hypothetical protein HDV64DRAFT_40412 [Trichoderma sp. TUCIM 5745]